MMQHFESQTVRAVRATCQAVHLLCGVGQRGGGCLALRGWSKCWWPASPGQHMESKVTLPTTGPTIKVSLQLGRKSVSVVLFPSASWWDCVSKYAEPSCHLFQAGVILEEACRAQSQTWRLLITISGRPCCDNATNSCLGAKFKLLFYNYCHRTKELEPWEKKKELWLRC